MSSWIIFAGVFLLLTGRSLHEGTNASGSRLIGFLGAVMDGLAMVAMALGLFGLLMALALGVFADSGPRLVGQSLQGVLVWSGGLMAASLALLVLGSLVRRAGGRPASSAMGGGH